jgi:hypothetical protein
LRKSVAVGEITTPLATWQLWFQSWGLLFNSAVKNSVENLFVTKVIMREFGVYHALHWIGCEYELLVKFS